MIKFRQKNFTEYDAMRSLYVELMKSAGDNRGRYKIIDSTALIPVLKGNNVVIEKFVIASSFFGRDKYRMYLKIGAKAKLPDDVRLPSTVNQRKLGSINLKFGGGFDPKAGKGLVIKSSGKAFSDSQPRIRLFSGNWKKDKNKNNQNNQGQNNNNNGGGFGASWSPSFDISYNVSELLGEALKYDKKERSLVLEFGSIRSAIEALNVLPFGIGYNICLLNA